MATAISSVGLFCLFAASDLPRAKAEARSAGSFSIAIPEFAASSPGLTEVAHRIHQIVEERLAHVENCIVSDTSVATTYSKFPPLPDLSAWQSQHARFLILGQIGLRENGRLKLEVQIFDVAERTALVGQQVFFSSDNWQDPANYLADKIVVQLNCPPPATDE